MSRLHRPIRPNSLYTTEPEDDFERDLKKIKNLVESKSKDFVKKSLNLNSWSNPLIMAIEKGFHQVVRFLVRLGADPLCSYRDEGSVTALHIAMTRCGSLKVLKALLEANNFDLNLTKKRKKRKRLVVTAFETRNLSMVKYLCERGMDVQEKDSKGLTCLMRPELFETEESEECFKILIQYGLSVDEVTPEGKTALHYAAEAKNLLLVQLLTSAGAKLILDKNGTSAIHSSAIATTLDDPEADVFEFLLTHADDEKTRNEALLLNAANILLDNFSEKGMMNLKRVLEMVYPSEKIEVDEVFTPNPAYYCLREARSYREFEQAENIQWFTKIQCFMIIERVLGPAHPRVRTTLYRYICQPALKSSANMRDNAIFLYTVSLYQRFLRDNRTRHVFLFSLRLFEEICYALERGYREKAKGGNVPFYYERISGFGMGLYKKMERSLIRSTDPAKPLGIDVNRFASIVILLKLPLFSMRTMIKSPQLLPVFVRAGANINAKMRSGETAMATVNSLALSFSNTSTRWHTSAENVEQVKQVYVHDKKNRNAFETLQRNTPFAKPFVLGNFITLKDMCAGVVEKNYKAAFLRKRLPPQLLEKNPEPKTRWAEPKLLPFRRDAMGRERKATPLFAMVKCTENITLQDICAEVVEEEYEKDFLRNKFAPHLLRYLGLYS
ncbi:unnamed protein product [Caenorhabditis auriculariae]|uniref:Uncharacterized protein n=1 Tax=Caenorhabditis auriculariae TaxID=2777116 RepID=A0A8S1H3V6_9PELO|nr:unnamed protein product [Caenorhabditis auriculariae]